MSKSVLSPQDYGRKMYDSLPEAYHKYDIEQKRQLQRYFDATSAGTEPIIEEVNKFLTFYDPEKVDMEVLPYIFASFGLEIFNGIPEPYLRNLLPLIGQLYIRKGTYEVIEYLTSLLTDAKVEVEAVTLKGTNAIFAEATFGRAVFGSLMKTRPGLNISIELAYGTYGSEMPDEDQIRRIIKEFVPFYMLVTVIYQYRYDEVADLIAKDVHVGDFIVHKTGEETELVAKDGGLENTVFIQDTDEKGILIRFKSSENAVLMRSILGKMVLGVEANHTEGQSAVFGKSVFGRSLYSRIGDGYMPYTYDWRVEDIISEDRVDKAEMKLVEQLLESVDGGAQDDPIKLFTNENKSDIIGQESRPDRLSLNNRGYLPKRSAVFLGGQPMGKSVFGVAQPYTSVDYTVDTIIYPSGDTREVVID